MRKVDNSKPSRPYRALVYAAAAAIARVLKVGVPNLRGTYELVLVFFKDTWARGRVACNQQGRWAREGRGWRLQELGQEAQVASDAS